MKTKSYNVYSFSELSAKAKQRALDKAREFIVQDEWWSLTYDDAKAMLKRAGFEIKEIGFSGFWSQGDGAHFEGSWDAKGVNVLGMMEHAPQDGELHRIAQGMAEIAKAYPSASLTVKHSGHYQHEFCTDFTVELADSGEWPANGNETEDKLIKLSRDAMRWIYRQLEQEYEWQTANEQLIEMIEANEYEFTEDGTID